MSHEPVIEWMSKTLTPWKIRSRLITLISPWFLGGVTSSLWDSSVSDWLLLLFSWIFCTSSWTLGAVGDSQSSFFAASPCLSAPPRLIGDSGPSSVLVWNWVVVVKCGMGGLREPSEKPKGELVWAWRGEGENSGAGGPGLGSLKLVNTAWGPAPELVLNGDWKKRTEIRDALCCV